MGSAVVAWMLAAAVGVVAAAERPSASPPDALWAIVSTCVDRAQPAPFCACPAFARSCCGQAAPDRDVVWAETREFVVIRNMTMCGCGPDFVAGLAMPRARITGIEDPKRPDGIWPFAWNAARARIADPLEIALVINPDDERTQNQMHVHLVRLRPDVRRELAALVPPDAIVLHLPDLGGVFSAAVARVGATAIGTYGILVLQDAARGWLAVLTDRASPETYTRHHCVPGDASPLSSRE
jgi:CDP-diacylglycerol pyrophosphatase